MSSIKEKYLEVDSGAELFIQEAGKGDPIIFIPGFTFTTETFSKQLDFFENKPSYCDGPKKSRQVNKGLAWE